MTKKVKQVVKSEDDCEDWCFQCKDGGELIICEHKDCVKSYHDYCVGLDVKAKSRFICDWHKCEDCKRASDFQCYVCPLSVCGRCIKSADFVLVKGKKGFCGHCLKLTLLVEEDKDVDSDGEKVDFHNQDTYETLFKEYWLIMNEEKKVTLDELISAKAQLKSRNDNDSDNDEDVDVFECSDFEENEEIEEIEPCDSGKKLKRSTPGSSKKKVNKKFKTEVKAKSNKEEFNGWGSNRIIDFLKYLKKDTTHPLSQRDLETIIKRYSSDNKLLQKKTIECDEWLKSIFKRKTIKLNRIYDSLETHLAENQVSSSDDEDEIECDSEERDLDVDEELVFHKNKKKKIADKIIEKKEVIHYWFASVVPENIRLVYLRRSLVQKFEKEPDTFESRVIGSFVRVKDSNGCFSRKYQLMQVTGAKNCSVGENETFVLQALDTDIRIDSLSDDDFSEEECQELRNKVKSGLLKKLELVELEAKAKFLHRDIVTHWIPRQLTLLKHRINQANEKGWRKELHEYLESREFLQKPENQSKLLEKVPNVVPDNEEAEPVEDDKKDDKESPKSILTHTSYENFKDVGITSEEIKQEDPASETYEMAMKLDKFFTSLKRKDKYKQASAVKNLTQLFDSIDEESTIDTSNEDLEDTESSQWHVTSSSGDTVGPVSLSVLKNMIQAKAASESKIYRTGQTKEQAKPLTAVLRLAFPKEI